jgi:Ser/Thr protein kinase RdoA (MazF antagonist)
MAALESALAQAGWPRPERLERAPSEYRTSFPIEDLDVRLENGSRLQVVFKQLGWKSLDESARRAKPDFLHDPLREPSVYASLLAPAELGTPRLYGSFSDPPTDRFWLFLERVAGVELYQVGDVALWQETARWLARMHARFPAELDRRRGEGRLLDYDAAYYRRWIDRALEFAGAHPDAAARRTGLSWLAERYDAAIDDLLDLPKTVIHGELYASNVLVEARDGEPRVRICPVDWELAATAPGLVDLAALVSGAWSSADRQAIVSAYAEESGGDLAASRRGLDLCRLHLAVQWLGWAPADWEPPEDHRHDWLGEAVSLAEALDL